MTNVQSPTSDRHRVVVIGSGFGGLFGTKALARADVDVTMIAKTTHHLFQPLLYQVATGILSEGEIAPPTREVLAGQKNARVILGEVTDIDLETRTGHLARARPRVTVTPYDSLIVAAGAGQSYFGNDQFAEFAPGHEEHRRRARAARPDLRRLRAGRDLPTSEEEIERLLTFVVVGAGPTGVEMAGQIAELAHRTLQARLPPDQHPRGAGDPARRRAAGAAAVRRASWARRPRRRWRSSASRSSSARWSPTSTSGASRSQDKDGTRAPHRGGHQGLGRRRAGQPARQAARRADRRLARPRRPDRGQPRPHAARATPRCSWSAT